MPAYDSYAPLDTTPLDQSNGADGVFVGVNMRVSPDKLPEGMLSNSVNKRLNSGRADTRRGLFELAAQYVGTTALGACVFSNPEGYEGIAVATANYVYIIRDSNPPVAIGLGNGVTLSGPIWMVQAFDKIILFRGDGLTPLEWDGEVDTQFEAIEMSASGSGTLPIPGAATAVAYLNRLFVPYKEGNRVDSVLVSDDVDYTRYVSQLSQFRINWGTADDIVRLVPYGRATLVCFKGTSIAYWTNLGGDMTDSIAAEITRETGLVAPRAVAQIGSELWFLGRGGVYKVAPGADDKLLMGEQTMSAPMQPFFDQVNWAEADEAIMAVDEERLYVVVPFGMNATSNNAVAVYNHVTGQWEGYDTFAASVNCLALLETKYLGKREIWWVDNSGRVGIMNCDLGYDWWAGSHTAISDTITTRGYYGRIPGRKRFTTVSVGLQTWQPAYSIAVATDGPGEGGTIKSSTSPSRTAYRINRTAYTLTNANDDHDLAYRGDYAVLGSDNMTPRTLGSLSEQHADQLVRGRLIQRGDYLTVTIANTQGSCRVRRVAVDALAADGGIINYA